MEADSDDLATDFGQEEHIQVTPENQNPPIQSNNDDWDESRFQKSLIPKEETNSAQKPNPEEPKKDQPKKNDLKEKRTFFNDKNFIIEGEQDPDDEPQNTPEQMDSIFTSSEPEHQNRLKEVQNQLEQLQIEQKKSEPQHQHINEQNMQVALISQNQLQIKEYSSEPQYISKFSTTFKSQTISLNETLDEAEQSKYYFENLKIIMTEPITSMNSETVFRFDNIKYCVGVGVGIQEILEKHQYDYKSTTSTEMGHGLYIVTSQGYSWSHSEQSDDDAFREGFNKLYSGINMKVKLEGENLTIEWKKASFSMVIPSRIREKYRLCFCVYLHEKTDSVSIAQK